MGDTLELFQPLCNGAVRVETRTEKLTGDAGFLLLREALDRTALINALAVRLEDPRDPRRITHSLPALLRASVAMIAQGWGDQSDAARLHDDPVLAIAANDRAGVGAAKDALASQATFSRCLDLLSQEKNRAVLETAPLELAARRLRAQGRKPLARITLDIDGLPLSVHGEQPGSAYNGHVRERIHYPLIASCAETGDLLAALLRDGNAGPAQQAATWIPRIVQAAREHLAPEVQVRLDAGFTDGATLAALDAARIPFVGRLRENPVLTRLFDPHRTRGRGRPALQPREWVVEASYQAGSWEQPRRLLIVVQEHPTELFRNAFFLVTSLSREDYSGAQVLALYRRRGKAEAHMGEFKDVIGSSLPCTSRGVASEATVLARSQALLSLRLLAYQLLHVLRTEMEAVTWQGWSLRRLRERVLKAGARLLTHARRITVVIERRAAAHWRRLFLRWKHRAPLPT
jgi:hypothetical protein